MSAVPDLKPCSICRTPADSRFAPFCSQRCADVDLQSWLTGRYAIPVDPDEDDAEDVPAPDDNAGQRRRDFL